MPDEPIPVRRKIGLERCDDRREHTTDALAHNCKSNINPLTSNIPLLIETRSRSSRCVKVDRVVPNSVARARTNTSGTTRSTFGHLISDINVGHVTLRAITMIRKSKMKFTKSSIALAGVAIFVGAIAIRPQTTTAAAAESTAQPKQSGVDSANRLFEAGKFAEAGKLYAQI